MRANRGSDFSNFSPQQEQPLPRTPHPSHPSHTAAHSLPLASSSSTLCVCPWPPLLLRPLCKFCNQPEPAPGHTEPAALLSCHGLIVTLSRIYLFIYSFLCRLIFFILFFNFHTQDANDVFSLLHFRIGSDRLGSDRSEADHCACPGRGGLFATAFSAFYLRCAFK